jgi:hypothetical protein
MKLSTVLSRFVCLAHAAALVIGEKYALVERESDGLQNIVSFPV